MIWVLIFGGIAVAGLVMGVCYLVWLSHKTADVLSEVGVVMGRLEQLATLVASIQVPGADSVQGSFPDPVAASIGAGSEYQTYDNEGVTSGRVGKED